MSYKDFTEMSVWQKGYELVLEVYKHTRLFPKNEQYGITQDIRRAANSIIHNIAEGFGRFSPKDKTRLYKIARGSGFEVISQILIAGGLQYIPKDNQDILIEKLRSIIHELNTIIKTLEKR